MKISNLTRLNAIIGYPLTHSQSPSLHQTAYQRLGLNAVMLPIATTQINSVPAAIKTLPIHLTAVTMPFKQIIMPLLDVLEPAARQVGAVNTVVNKHGKLYGYNTDVFGIQYALRECELKGKNVLLLGAGGAAAAVAYVVSRQKARLMYVNRTPGKAAALQKKFGGRVVKTKQLKSKDIDMIINATPIGMVPKTNGMPVDSRLIAKRQTVFDLVYNPLQTRLLKFAELRGAKTVFGLEMFVAQGLRQIEIWTGRKIISLRLIKLLIKRLA